MLFMRDMAEKKLFIENNHRERLQTKIGRMCNKYVALTGTK